MTPAEVVRIAQNLARNRALAVFPCLTSKKPACPHGFEDASTDPSAIAELWHRHLGPLIGVATGRRSGIDLLDVDCGDWPTDAKPTTIEKHESARAWWHANYRRLPETLTFRSRSRGLHLYFVHSDVVTCTTSRIAKGIDTRSTGGYAIWWFADGCECLNPSPPAPWPTWLLTALVPPPAPPHRAYTPRPRHGSNSIKGILRIVETAGQGERNARLHWAACRLGERVRAGQIGLGDAEALLITAAAAAGLKAPEARATARSGLRRGTP